MGQMNIIPCPIEGLYIIEPRVFGDERGYFVESYNERDMFAAGMNMRFVQDNESMSARGVLRGLHYQRIHPQGKLVRALRGRVYDVVVDIRKDSPTYGRYYGVELSEKNHRQFYISPGFAHGYLSLSEHTVFGYKVTDYYHPEDEAGFVWDDPDIAIKWPEVDAGAMTLMDGTPLIINARDCNWPRFRDISQNGTGKR